MSVGYGFGDVLLCVYFVGMIVKGFCFNGTSIVRCVLFLCYLCILRCTLCESCVWLHLMKVGSS